MYVRTLFSPNFLLVAMVQLLCLSSSSPDPQKMVELNPRLSQTLGTFFLPKNIVEPSLLDTEVTLRLTRIHGMEQRKIDHLIHT